MQCPFLSYVLIDYLRNPLLNCAFIFRFLGITSLQTFFYVCISWPLTHESRMLKRFFKYVTYTNDRTFLKCFVGINTYYPSSPSALICFPAGGRTLVPNNSHLCLCLYSDEGLFQGPRYFLSSVSATDPLAHVSSTILAYSLYTHAIYVYLVIYFLNPVALLTSSWSIDERLWYLIPSLLSLPFHVTQCEAIVTARILHCYILSNRLLIHVLHIQSIIAFSVHLWASSLPHIFCHIAYKI